MKDYKKSELYWNEVFDKEPITIPSSKESGIEEFDKGLSWLCEDSSTIVDFGCGAGTILFLCSYYGTSNHIGIDLSKSAIDNAIKRSSLMPQGTYDFRCSGIDSLKTIKDNSVDAFILSNIVDNIYPEDAHLLLTESKRILKKNGKLFIKLNPYLTESDIKNYNIRVIKDNILDDGLILWNNTTEEWNTIISSYFSVYKYTEIYYSEYDQYNRMFLVQNK